ncbi:Double-stranded RNA-binding domain-containing protein [Dioscorea alata]|uniref:Double-stranded RNA-binding domain-containing protein n=2 Tax=Dioscorea alata TaxID=55571 RepID=A0ACB7U3P7_DIOAL|nr:Double-stranded RNA-binding domain-containing protein [Dioscorea alata]KAH7654964.1 Double-stranded RNA-binding domain-containing protein [Dioscorea alata]
MYKNQLQELAQRSCFNLPSYACIREGPDHAPRFKATVNFNGETFESPTFCTTLRQAEHAAAEVALCTLSKRGPSKSLASRVLDETGVYKNLLQETAHRAGLKLPVYTTIRSGPGHTPVFSCTVELAGMSFDGDPAKTKKQAQKNAAMAAWSALKKLPNLGSSSSSSMSENEGNEEQEQVVIARALASLCQAEENKSSYQSDRQHLRQKPASVRRDTRSIFNASFHAKHYDGVAYPNLSPEVMMYQMWQQEQASLLTIPTPDISDPRLLPFFLSTFQPSQGQYFLRIEQDLINPAPCFSKPSLGMPFYFSEYPLSVSARNQSQANLQEISRVEDQENRKEWVHLSGSGGNSNGNQVNHQSDASVFHPEDACGTSKVQELLEDDNTVGLSDAEGSSSFTSHLSSVKDSGECKKIQESQQSSLRKSKNESERITGTSAWQRQTGPNTTQVLQQDAILSDPMYYISGVHRPQLMNSPGLTMRSPPPFVTLPCDTSEWISSMLSWFEDWISKTSVGDIGSSCDHKNCCSWVFSKTQISKPKLRCPCSASPISDATSVSSASSNIRIKPSEQSDQWEHFSSELRV